MLYSNRSYGVPLCPCVIMLTIYQSITQFLTHMFVITFLIIWATSWQNLLLSYAYNSAFAYNICVQQRLICVISAFVVRCLDGITPLVSTVYIRNVKPLPSFFDCTGRFVTYLVANPEDRFSRDEAHIFLHTRPGFPWSRPGLGNVVLHEGV